MAERGIDENTHPGGSYTRPYVPNPWSLRVECSEQVQSLNYHYSRKHELNSVSGLVEGHCKLPMHRRCPASSCDFNICSDKAQQGNTILSILILLDYLYNVMLCRSGSAARCDRVESPRRARQTAGQDSALLAARSSYASSEITLE